MTAQELSDASGFSFDVPEGAKNVIYRYADILDSFSRKQRVDG
ncbi:MAG: hypothetical protein Q4B32_11615 [Clostridia bacterium]|nr:hypothetical protein [Clostridia bacterium]